MLVTVLVNLLIRRKEAIVYMRIFCSFVTLYLMKLLMYLPIISSFDLRRIVFTLHIRYDVCDGSMEYEIMR